jgi:rhamnosyltransferase
VTYHPDEGLPSRLESVIAQVGALVIVDNGSFPAELSMLASLAERPSVALIRNSDNLGIARALNSGVRRAAQGGFTWALLLDQDTRVDPDIVERLLASYGSCPDPEKVAAVGSRFRDPEGRPLDRLGLESLRLESRGEQWEEVQSVITSGSLLSLAAYAAVGPFRDDFFIDYVDTEFCFRARAAGFRVIESVRPLMSHTVGAPTAHKLFWSTTWTTNHSPDRRYYIARNNTVLLREYGTRGRGPWQWKSLVRCLRLCKRIAYFEHEKISKIAAVGQGWWHGVRGKMGPRPRRPSRTRASDRADLT